MYRRAACSVGELATIDIWWLPTLPENVFMGLGGMINGQVVYML